MSVCYTFYLQGIFVVCTLNVNDIILEIVNIISDYYGGIEWIYLMNKCNEDTLKMKFWKINLSQIIDNS